VSGGLAIGRAYARWYRPMLALPAIQIVSERIPATLLLALPALLLKVRIGIPAGV